MTEHKPLFSFDVKDMSADPSVAASPFPTLPRVDVEVGGKHLDEALGLDALKNKFRNAKSGQQR